MADGVEQTRKNITDTVKQLRFMLKGFEETCLDEELSPEEYKIEVGAFINVLRFYVRILGPQLEKYSKELPPKLNRQ